MEDYKLKYLEMIQNIITRMASNSFILKGWAVTLITGTFALSSKDTNSWFFLIAYVPIIFFWFLDSYYLQMERKYRILYNQIVDIPSNQISFKFDIKSSMAEDKTLFIQCFVSCTECGFYIPMVVLVSVIVILIK